MSSPRPAAGLAALQEVLRRTGPVVVAFSGGADSAFLARVAHDLLGPEQVLCVTALSPSLAGEEEADCRALAAEWGLRWQGVSTAELEDPAYVANGADRCARCKTALPLILGTGTGSELRRPLGLSIAGGLLLSQLLTLYTTPVVYLFFDRLSRRAKAWAGVPVRASGPLPIDSP